MLAPPVGGGASNARLTMEAVAFPKPFPKQVLLRGLFAITFPERLLNPGRAAFVHQTLYTLPIYYHTMPIHLCENHN